MEPEPVSGMDAEVEDADELDQLLQESLGKPKAAADPLDDLDQLLQESVALRDEASAISQARDRLKRQSLSLDERRETEALIRSWEARRVWLTVADVTVWEVATCDCGSVHRTFSHTMHKQTHRDSPTTIRLVKADTWSEGLPTLVAHQEVSVPLCAECAHEWDIDATKPDLTWEA